MFLVLLGDVAVKVIFFPEGKPVFSFIIPIVMYANPIDLSRLESFSEVIFFMYFIIFLCIHSSCETYLCLLMPVLLYSFHGLVSVLLKTS